MDNPMKRSSRLAFLTLIVVGVFTGAPAPARAADGIVLVVDAKVPVPAERALSDLQRALKDRKIDTTRQQSLPKAGSALVVGVAGASPLVDQLLVAHRIELPKAAESLCLKRIDSDA